MKNLLIITLFFFSIGAMAEDNYRCEFYKICYDESCKTKVQTSFVSLKVNEGWFKDELIFDGVDYSKNTLFGENILRWGVYAVENLSDETIPGVFSNYTWQHKFDKTSLVLTSYKSYREPQELSAYKNFTFRKEQFLCEKIN